MKKILLLPLFATMALAQEWVNCTGEYAGYCKWPTSCNQIASGPPPSGKATCAEAYENCKVNGFLYTDAACTTWSGIGNDPTYNGGWCLWDTGCEYIKDAEELANCQTNGYHFTDATCTTWSGIGNDPNFNGGVSIYCKWDTGCESIKDEKELDNCKTNGYLYSDATCATWANLGNDPAYNAGYCKWDTGCVFIKNETELNSCKKYGSLYSDATCATWTGVGRDPAAVVLGCCKWETETNCYPIWSGLDYSGEEPTYGEYKVANCSSGKNTFWEGSGACPTTCPTTPPTYSPNATPGETPSSASAGDPSSSSEGSVSSSSEGATPIISHSPLNANHPTKYYSLKGEPVGSTKPQKAGVYIVKQGNSIKKIVVR